MYKPIPLPFDAISPFYSIGLENHTRSLGPEGPDDLIHFYNIGLEGYNGQKKMGNSTWTVRTFSALYNYLDPGAVSVIDEIYSDTLFGDNRKHNN